MGMKLSYVRASVTNITTYPSTKQPLDNFLAINILLVVFIASICCFCTCLYVLITTFDFNLAVKKYKFRSNVIEVSRKRTSRYRFHRRCDNHSSSQSTSQDQTSYRIPKVRPHLKVYHRRTWQVHNRPRSELPTPPKPPLQKKQQIKLAPMAPHSSADHKGPYTPPLISIASRPTTHTHNSPSSMIRSSTADVASISKTVTLKTSPTSMQS